MVINVLPGRPSEITDRNTCRQPSALLWGHVKKCLRTTLSCCMSCAAGRAVKHWLGKWPGEFPYKGIRGWKREKGEPDRGSNLAKHLAQSWSGRPPTNELDKNSLPALFSCLLRILSPHIPQRRPDHSRLVRLATCSAPYVFRPPRGHLTTSRRIPSRSRQPRYSGYHVLPRPARLPGPCLHLRELRRSPPPSAAPTPPSYGLLHGESPAVHLILQPR